MNWKGRKVMFTWHTTERLQQFGVSFEDGLKMFSNSNKEKLDRGLSKKKREKYHGNQNVFYTRYDEFVFTVKDTTDFKTGRPIWLVLTATNQMINLKNYKYVR